VDPIELFKRQRFSTAEAAKILDIPLATLKSRLNRRWLPVADLEEWDRRRWTIDDLLRVKLAEELSKRGVQFSEGRSIIAALQPTWFGGAVFLVVPIGHDGVPKTSHLCGVPDLGVLLGNNDGPSAVVISINVACDWLQNRIDEFYRDIK
jgi:predicted HTH domain antitoxin